VDEPNARDRRGSLGSVDRQETTALLRRVRDGSPGALDALLGHCAGRLLTAIRLRLGPDLRARIESRDVLQACLLKSFERIGEFERSEGASLQAWLARIAENEIRDLADYHHRRRRDLHADTPLADDRPLVAHVRSQLSQVILSQEMQRLARALERLSAEHREVIVLRRLEERSWGEIAERTGRTVDACRMLLARAMAALIAEMEHPAGAGD
jgi:RNA polymerase sigma-70 factor (ECF subfamily)